MKHLTEEQIFAFLDKDEEHVNLKKATKHLDSCLMCTKLLREIAALNLLLVLNKIQRKQEEAWALLRNCLSDYALTNYASGQLLEEQRRGVEKHLQECALCRQEVEIERAMGGSTEDRLPAEKIVYSELLFLLLRYERLLSIAVEKERIEEEKKLLKETVLERIKKWLFPVRLLPVPLGFAEEVEPDENFYRALSDDDLVFACQQKKQIAWRVFIERFQKLAISIVMRHGLGTGFEDWEDLWKKAQIRLYLKIKDCERGKIVSFVYSFVRNVCREKIREETQERKLFVSLNNHMEKNEQGNTEASTFSQQLGPNQVAEPVKEYFVRDESLRLMISQEKQEELEEAIRMLPAEFSEVLWLVEMEDYAEKEASDELNIPIGTVKSRLSRARPKLFEKIRAEKLKLWKQLSSIGWVMELLKKLSE